jgi:hypothetical protein
MARYNSVNSTGSVTQGSSIASPASGLLTTITTGSGTTNLPNPVLYAGSVQTFYNATVAAITLSTPSGVFTGPATGGANTLTLPAGSIITLVSDGTNYIAQDWLGGPASHTSITASGTITAQSTVTFNPSNANVSIQPTGTGTVTINPASVGSIDNMNIGATTKGTGAFTTLTATGVTALTSVTAVALGTAASGALQVTGGVGIGGGLYVAGASNFGGITTFTSSQASTGTGSGALQVTGGVGIAGALNVGGNITFGQLSYTSTGFLTIASSGGGSFFQGTQVGAGYGYPLGGIFNAISQGPGGLNYSFMGWQGATPTNTSFIRADGQAYFASGVGIGNNSPNDLLYVDNNSASSTAGITLASSGTTDARIYANGGNLVVNSLRTNPIYFQVNGNTYLTLMGNGNLAVNSTTTSYNLGVNGTIGSSSITTNYVYGTNRKEFNFGFSNNQVWFYIGYLPTITAGTGDAMGIEITGIVSSVNGKGRVKLGLGQRGGFWYSKSLEGNNPQVHCQVYNQADGSSQVWIYNSSLSYPAAEIIYYTYGWGGQNGVIQNGQGCTIYDVTSYQTTKPGGTLIFDSSNYSSYPVNEGLSVGALSKTSGSFRINHPLPALTSTHELVHSFIEGPKADLIYRGTVNLENGAATVDIDNVSTMTEGTFEVLCRDVQCFVNNTTGWDSVRGSVTGNILTIICQNTSSTDTVSWMVIGERKDPHMYETDWTDEEGHVIVEPLKEIIVAPPPEPYVKTINTNLKS